jgi:hypothetical protein
MTAATKDSTQAPRRLRWYQFSLRSLLVTMTVFAILTGVNTRPSYVSVGSYWAVDHIYISHNDFGDVPPGREVEVMGNAYGWPFAYRTIPSDESWSYGFDRFYWWAVAADAIVGLIIIAITIFAVEAAIRCLQSRLRC